MLCFRKFERTNEDRGEVQYSTVQYTNTYSTRTRTVKGQWYENRIRKYGSTIFRKYFRRYVPSKVLPEVRMEVPSKILPYLTFTSYGSTFVFYLRTKVQYVANVVLYKFRTKVKLTEVLRKYFRALYTYTTVQLSRASCRTNFIQ
jgi:hypothetical protein